MTGKAGENGQNLGNRAAAHPGQDRRLPGVVTHPRPQQASARSTGPGQPGSGVAIDWVTGRSCCAMKAGRRLNARSGLRKGKGDKCFGHLASSVAVRDRH